MCKVHRQTTGDGKSENLIRDPLAYLNQKQNALR